MVANWDDDERNVNDHIRYEPITKADNLYKGVLEYLNEDKYNQWNEVEYINYAFDCVLPDDVDNDDNEDGTESDTEDNDSGDDIDKNDASMYIDMMFTKLFMYT